MPQFPEEELGGEAGLGLLNAARCGSQPIPSPPSQPGVIELVGSDGLVYRGRTAPGTESPRDSSPQK